MNDFKLVEGSDLERWMLAGIERLSADEGVEIPADVDYVLAVSTMENEKVTGFCAYRPDQTLDLGEVGLAGNEIVVMVADSDLERGGGRQVLSDLVPKPAWWHGDGRQAHTAQALADRGWVSIQA